MMFVLASLGLVAVLGAIFWYGLSKSSASSDAKTKFAALAVFVGLSGLVYGLSGEPDYTSPRLFAEEQEALAAALRPDGLGAVEVYGNLVIADSQDKNAWLDSANALRLARRPVETADSLLRAAKLAETLAEQAALYGAAGETLVMAKAGLVDDEAVAAFTSALQADAASLGALYYMGRRARSVGDEATARSYWSRFLAAAPPAHPLVIEVQGDLALLGTEGGESARIAPVLTSQMIEQFEGLTEEERGQQIASMLGRVEARLTERGSDSSAAEWRELARAFIRVEDVDSANKAYERAVELAPDDVALALEYAQTKP